MKKDLFLLSWKKFSISMIIFIVLFLFSNVWGRLLGISGLIFSNTGLLILAYLLLCMVYSLSKGENKLKFKRQKNKKIKNIFLLSWKRLGCTFIVWIIAVVIHNFGSALLGFEESVFFIFAVIVIPLYLIIAIIYSIIKKVGKK